MNSIVILGKAAIVFLIGILTICYFGIRKCLRKIKECDEGMQRCAENAVKDPNDCNWIYMKYTWRNFRTEYVLTVWLISILIVISLSAITYISYMLNNII